MAMTGWAVHTAEAGQRCFNIILCDDDADFLDRLRSGVTRIFTKLRKSVRITPCSSPEGIPPALLTACDMAFLDIDFEHEDQNGIDIARALRQGNSHALIFFVTNYIDYAPEGYEVQAFRYILKRDLDEVLERYLLQAMERFSGEQEVLRLQSADESIDIPLSQISYLEVMDHSVSIHTQGQCYTLSATLSALEDRLASHGFLRIHKSYLVNMRCIRKFRSRECLLLDGTTLAVGEKNYSRQKQTYLLWKGLK